MRTRARPPRPSGAGAPRSTIRTSSCRLAPLAEHRKEIIVLEGIDNARGNHPGYSSASSGSERVGISIDQQIAKAIGGSSRFPSLQFGVLVGPTDVGSYQYASMYEGGKGAPAENNPQAMFSRVFGDVRTDPRAVETLLVQKRSVLDAAIAQAESLRARVGAEDRAKIDDYLQSFRDVERRLALGAGGGQACGKPTEPGRSRNFWHDASNMPVTAKVQIDLLVMALACDLTRVATLQIVHEANNIILGFLGIKTRWHDLSHTGPHLGGEFRTLMPDFVKLNRWMAAQFAYLVGRMKELRVFDGSLALWIDGMQNAQVHDSHNLPVVLAGSLGGMFRTGRHLRLAMPGDRGRYVNDLHLTLAQAFGSTITTFGDAAKCKGPLDVLRTTGPSRSP